MFLAYRTAARISRSCFVLGCRRAVARRRLASRVVQALLGHFAALFSGRLLGSVSRVFLGWWRSRVISAIISRRTVAFRLPALRIVDALLGNIATLIWKLRRITFLIDTTVSSITRWWSLATVSSTVFTILTFRVLVVVILFFPLSHRVQNVVDELSPVFLALIIGPLTATGHWVEFGAKSAFSVQLINRAFWKGFAGTVISVPTLTFRALDFLALFLR